MPYPYSHEYIHTLNNTVNSLEDYRHLSTQFHERIMDILIYDFPVFDKFLVVSLCCLDDLHRTNTQYDKVRNAVDLTGRCSPQIRNTLDMEISTSTPSHPTSKK